MEGEPLDEVQWRAPEWIQAFGLSTENVLEYFAQSPFYDRSSNNQVLKMQSQFNGTFYGRSDMYTELKNMVGLEFVIIVARPPDLWVIRKQNRLSSHEVQQLATYFVIGENIYQAPSVYSIVSSRLLSTTLALSKSLELATSLQTLNPAQGYPYSTEPMTKSQTGDTSTPLGSVNSLSAKKTPASVSRYASPSAASASTPMTNGALDPSIAANQIIQERENDRSIEHALLFTERGTASYLDDPNREVYGQDKRKTQSSTIRNRPRKQKGSV